MPRECSGYVGYRAFVSVTISIVVPVYNPDPSGLARALRSIAVQTTPISELVIVDDGSNEALEEEWLASHMHEVPTGLRLIRQPNAGAGPARNSGASLATGDYLAFLDSDDTLRPDWMKRFGDSVQSRNPLLVSCSVETHLTTRVDKTRSFTSKPTAKGPAFFGLRACFLPGAYAVRRDVYWELGGFDPECTYGEHHELGLRLALFASQQPNPTVEIDQVLVDRYTVRSSAVVKRYAQARLESSIYTLDKHYELFARDPSRKANYLAVAGVAAAGLRRYKLSRSLLIQSAVVAPSPKRIARAVVAFAAPMVRRWMPEPE